jgi:hypothetical protein
MASAKSHLHFTVPVARAAQRFRELIVYVSQKCARDPHFGAVKLNKILYHSDFRAFVRFGVPLTGFGYFRLQKGPAPKALVPIRRELESEGAIHIEHVPLGDLEQHRTVALRQPVLEHFTSDELQVVDEVINELWEQSAAEVSDASHDVRWRVLRHKDDMPYEFAFLSNEDVTQKDIQRTHELSRQFGWT